MTNSVGFMNHERLFIMRMTIEFLPGARNTNARTTRSRDINGNVSDTIKSVYHYKNKFVLFLKKDNSVLLFCKSDRTGTYMCLCRTISKALLHILRYLDSRVETAFTFATTARMSRDFIPWRTSCSSK